MSEKIIKSADRVKDIGEVFTPRKTVDFMLDQPEIRKSKFFNCYFFRAFSR